MESASPGAKALMWSAGVTARPIIPTFAALCAWLSAVPWSGWFCLFASGWALGALASTADESYRRLHQFAPGVSLQTKP